MHEAPWRQTKPMFRLFSIGAFLLLLPVSLGLVGPGTFTAGKPASGAARASTLPGWVYSATAERRATRVDHAAFEIALDHNRGFAIDLTHLTSTAGTPPNIDPASHRKTAVLPSFSTSIYPDLEIGVEDCLPDDARCRAFVAGDGPGKGRFVGELPDGTELEVSRFQGWRQLRCLAYAAWSEARSEGTEGMLAVMQLILHRVGHEAHPDTVCGVVSEPRQFDAMLSKKSRAWLKAAQDRDAMVPAMPRKLAGPDAEAARAALTLAWRLMTGQIETDLTGGATFYATVDLIEKRGSDVLAPNLEPTTIVGEHAFFKPVEADLVDVAAR